MSEDRRRFFYWFPEKAAAAKKSEFALAAKALGSGRGKHAHSFRRQRCEIQEVQVCGELVPFMWSSSSRSWWRRLRVGQAAAYHSFRVTPSPYLHRRQGWPLAAGSATPNLLAPARTAP
jgi:hypothetical protein